MGMELPWALLKTRLEWTHQTSLMASASTPINTLNKRFLTQEDFHILFPFSVFSVCLIQLIPCRYVGNRENSKTQNKELNWNWETFAFLKICLWNYFCNLFNSMPFLQESMPWNDEIIPEIIPKKLLTF